MQKRTRKKRVRIPPSVRRFLYFIMDVVDRLKNPGSLVPPRSLRFHPAPVFLETGKKYKNILIEYCDLHPDHRILDIGSGEGRAAIPLTGYLSGDGEYWGVDTRKESIEWCQKRITSKYKNFYFQHWDIFNQQYNPQGSLRAEGFTFMFDDERFDIVFLMSVFTHMRPETVNHYLGEISRVLKVGGKCLFTIFLLTEEFKSFSSPGINYLDFKNENEDYSIADREENEFSTAFREGFILDLLEQYPLELVQRKRPGTWINRNPFLEAQELFVLKRS